MEVETEAFLTNIREALKEITRAIMKLCPTTEGFIRATTIIKTKEATRALVGSELPISRTIMAPA
jgi:hypothetical protein